jgi:hypothetical protein
MGRSGQAGLHVFAESSVSDQMHVPADTGSALHQHLLHPPATTPTQNFATPPLPPLPSPQLQGTSPSGSRLNFGFPGSRKSSMHAPESEFEPVQSPPVPRRKSTFSLAPRKKDIELKLPKEFLAEFWGVLGDEQGEAGWSETVAIFLGDVKKGTKTSTGLNLREIPVLLECESDLSSRVGLTICSLHTGYTAAVPSSSSGTPPSVPFLTPATLVPAKIDSLLPNLEGTVGEGQGPPVPTSRGGPVLHAGDIPRSR